LLVAVGDDWARARIVGHRRLAAGQRARHELRVGLPRRAAAAPTEDPVAAAQQQRLQRQRRKRLGRLERQHRQAEVSQDAQFLGVGIGQWNPSCTGESSVVKKQAMVYIIT